MFLALKTDLLKSAKDFIWKISILEPSSSGFKNSSFISSPYFSLKILNGDCISLSKFFIEKPLGVGRDLDSKIFLNLLLFQVFLHAS